MVVEQFTLEELGSAVQRRLKEGQPQDAVALLAPLHPADQAEVFRRLSPREQVLLLRAMDVEDAAELLEELHEREAAEVADDLSPEHLADILDEMDPEDAADLLGDLPPDLARILLAEMEEAEDVAPLLQYPDDTAGGLMSTEYVALHQEATVRETIAALRAFAAEEIEIPYYLFVVDEQNHLVGVVDVRDLLTAPPQARVRDIMDPKVMAVHVSTDQEEVAHLMRKYELAVLPVVDDQNRLVGIISYEDVLHVLSEEAVEDILHLGGVESAPLLQKPYWGQQLWEVVRSRLPWLLLLFVAATLTSTVIGLFESLLARRIVLSRFIPLLIGTGGNVGGQTVATLIRALVLREIRPRDAFRVWLREARIALLLGLVLGGVAFVGTQAWGVDLSISTTVALTMLAIVLWAATVATLVPLAATALGVDPTHVSGPLMSTLIDVTGLLLYFLVAQALLAL